MTETWATAEAVVRDPTGLHARPAVKLTKLAKGFASTVEVSGDGGTWINAKSPNAVMKLKVAHGAPLMIRASGGDAGEAVSALAALVEEKNERLKSSR